MKVEFTVVGKPQTAGSKKGFIVPGKAGKKPYVAIVDDNPKTKSWQGIVAFTAKQAWPSATLARGPVYLCAKFYFARPDSHYGTGRNKHTLKPSAPKDHTQRPDSLKLMRAIEDALSGVLYADDKQITDERHGKRWAGPGEPSRAEIVVIAATAVEEEKR